MRKKMSALVALIMSLQLVMSAIVLPVHAEVKDDPIYTEPESPSAVYNMNIDWKYKKPSTGFPLQNAINSADKNGKKFYEADYDDTDWETVSIPHQVNASDSFTALGSNQGDGGQYRGIVFYRKHFTVPADAAGKKLFIEFEGIDNAAYVWVNGQKAGYYEAGIAPFGFDITKYVTAGQEAVIALANDSTCGRGMENYYRETKPGSEWGSNDGSGYEWNSHEFRPTQAGLVNNVNLYVKSQVYQTLALYDNMKTTGTYIYANNFDIRNKKATINVKAEVRNETAKNEKLTLQVDVVKNIDPNEDDAAAEDHTQKPYLKYSFTGTGTAEAAKDAGVTYETVVKPETYDTEMVTTTEYIEQTEMVGDKKKYVLDENGYPIVEQKEVTKEQTVGDNITDVDTVDVSYIEASFNAEDLDFWSTEAPHLYDVYTILKNEAGEVVDVQKTTTGFRKVEYTIEDGLKINDKSVWLTGYAQRSSNEWAAIGSANDWLTDYDMSLVKESGANFIRWMHIAPREKTVRATDKYGIVVVAPAGDKEEDASGRQWSQRVEAMRSVMVRFRNSPSVIFWETGNNVVNYEHQQEMTDLKAKLDPDGGRFSGCRTLSSMAQIQSAEYVGTMLNRHASSAKNSMSRSGKLEYNKGEPGYQLTDANKPYVPDKDKRDKIVYPPYVTDIDVEQKYMPIVETEYHREESSRRVWDDFSPPDYDLDNLYKSDAATQGYDFYDFTSEEFVLNDARCYEEFYRDRVNGASGNNYYAAAAALCWTDSNQHSRTSYSENGRMSGRVDPIRLPKQSFYTYQVMQQESAEGENQVHIVGHWNYEPMDDKSREEGGNYYYPIKELKNGVWEKTGEWGRRDPTKKTVYAVGSQYVSKIELLVDGEVVGTCSDPTNTFIYAFPNIDVTKGDKVEAIAYDLRDNVIGRDEIKRVGEPVSVQLTPHTGAEGLLADGSDLMYFDVEVVDAEGNVCPLSYDKINFNMTGDAQFMGGYNSGYAKNKKEGWGAGETVIGKDYVYAECGINRVFVKAGRGAGPITLTATMDGASSAPVSITVNSVEYPEAITGGLTRHRQQELDFGTMPEIITSTVTPLKSLGKAVSVAKVDWAVSPFIYTVQKVIDKKDVYTVKLNGETVETVNQSYKPDAATGVLCDVKPVLDALKSLGADFTYTESGGTITVTSKKGQNGIDGSMHTFVIEEGTPAIGYDGDPEGILTNADITLEGGQLQMEIAAILSYIDGVSTRTDDSGKIFQITYAN